MVKLDTWEQVLHLKNQILKLTTERNKINAFLENPFENKSLTLAKRKAMWKTASKKKPVLEKELAETKKKLAKISDETRIKSKRYVR